MSLDRQSVPVQRGTDSDIRYASVTARFALEYRARDVNTALREQFLVRLQIHRREQELPSGARPPDDFSRKNERPAEQTTCSCDIAFCYLFPDECAGHDLPIQRHGFMYHDFKSAAHPQFAQEFDVSGLLVPEAKIIAHYNRTYLQLLHQKLPYEFLGCQLR